MAKYSSLVQMRHFPVRRSGSLEGPVQGLDGDLPILDEGLEGTVHLVLISVGALVQKFDRACRLFERSLV